MRTMKITQKLNYNLFLFLSLAFLFSNCENRKDTRINNTYLTDDFSLIDSSFINIPSEGSLIKKYQNKSNPNQTLTYINSIGTLKKWGIQILKENDSIKIIEQQSIYNMPLTFPNSEIKEKLTHNIVLFQNKIISWKVNQKAITEDQELKKKEGNILKILSDSRIIKFNNVPLKWIGDYELFQTLEKIDDIGIQIGYNIKINKDSIFFSGQGYQTNFYDLCYAKENVDTLNIYYSKTLEGTDYNKNEKGTIAKLFKSEDSFFIISPVIEDGEIKKDVPILIEKEK